MRGWALGLLHLSLREWSELRVGVFWEALDAHMKEVEAERRHVGELIRGATMRIHNLLASDKGREMKPEKFWTMPWDEKMEDKAEAIARSLASMTKAERDAQARKFLESINGKGE